MAVRKVPMRMCTACREMKPKMELIRVVKSSEGEISIDATGKKNGRGAYICKSVECFKKAKKIDALSRAFEIKVTEEIYNQLETELEKIEQ
ncbi:MAG: YlxR family protein [Clostridia bacterium]|nr:YlxR family protein [Clostridia bacterium]